MAVSGSLTIFWPSTLTPFFSKNLACKKVSVAESVIIKRFALNYRDVLVDNWYRKDRAPKRWLKIICKNVPFCLKVGGIVVAIKDLSVKTKCVIKDGICC